MNKGILLGEKTKFRKLTLIHYTLPVLRPHSRCASCPNNVWKNPVLWVWYIHQSQCSVPRVTGKETSVLMPLSLGHWNTCRLEYAILLTPEETWGWTWSSSWTWTSLIFPPSPPWEQERGSGQSSQHPGEQSHGSPRAAGVHRWYWPW